MPADLLHITWDEIAYAVFAGVVLGLLAIWWYLSRRPPPPPSQGVR